MAYDEVLARRIGDLLDDVPGVAWADGEAVNPMEMRGRPMTGWLLVDAAALGDDDQLGQWVDRGVRFVRTLPPKPPSP